MCQEKHMGSRAVVLVCRDGEVAARRFGVDDGTTGAVYTRTGRSFFTDPAVTEDLLARVRTAADGTFAELDTGWLLFDAELLPWSAKALPLIRSQYAAVGAAARTALSATTAALDAGLARGLDLGPLAAQVTERAADAEAFSAAYRRYCWPTDGLVGVRLAPFALLASEGAHHATRNQAWHLALCDRLGAADPELFASTGRCVVDLADDASTEAAVRWWLDLTGAGGEGMVVKPYDGLVRRGDRPVQPGVKCRGREYLRIIYGPDYTAPRHLDRLRDRGLGRKRGLALREHALGLAALDRLAGREPLWRVHEMVFGVLALESEPVDPRL